MAQGRPARPSRPEPGANGDQRQTGEKNKRNGHEYQEADVGIRQKPGEMERRQAEEDDSHRRGDGYPKQ